MNTYTIGKLAREATVNIETIRFYERKGLLPQPQRTKAGYRQYDEGDLKRLHFILVAKKHGFTLADIKELLELRVNPTSTCHEVRSKADEKIAVIEAKIAELESMKHALSALAETCHDDSPAGECPILDAFELT